MSLLAVLNNTQNPDGREITMANKRFVLKGHNEELQPFSPLERAPEAAYYAFYGEANIETCVSPASDVETASEPLLEPARVHYVKTAPIRRSVRSSSTGSWTRSLNNDVHRLPLKIIDARKKGRKNTSRVTCHYHLNRNDNESECFPDCLTVLLDSPHIYLMVTNRNIY